MPIAESMAIAGAQAFACSGRIGIAILIKP